MTLMEQDTSRNDIIALREMLDCVISDKGNYMLKGKLYSAYGCLLSYLPNNKEETALSIHKTLRHINNDVWNICTIASRIEWFRRIAQENQWTEKNPFLWSLYTGLDIELFFIEVRSILDYTAIALKDMSQKPAQVKVGSFREMYQWLEKNPGNKERLGQEASNVIQSAAWYKEIRQLRDDMIHRGFDTVVFGSPRDGVLFQVLSGLEGKVHMEALMWNENVVDFQLYVGLYFARIYALLNKLGTLILNKYQKSECLAEVTASHSGIMELSECANKLLIKLESQK